MINIVYILLIILQLGVIVFFVRRSRQLRKTMQPPRDAGKPSFEQLRLSALSVKASDLKLDIPANVTAVYGLIMDWNTGEHIASLATYLNGAASLYFSTGGGVTAAGLDESIALSAMQLVNLAGEQLVRAMPVKDAPLPPAGCVRFDLLTTGGVYAAQEAVQFFDDGSSPWLPIFDAANNIISAMNK
jgi:hypothetical protein